jgi:hypothetical protein
MTQAAARTSAKRSVELKSEQDLSAENEEARLVQHSLDFPLQAHAFRKLERQVWCSRAWRASRRACTTRWSHDDNADPDDEFAKVGEHELAPTTVLNASRSEARQIDGNAALNNELRQGVAGCGSRCARPSTVRLSLATTKGFPISASARAASVGVPPPALFLVLALLPP